MNEQNEKQAIEEMRELIHAEIKKSVDIGLITWTEFAQHLTERLTEQGYRKQEWISVEERLPQVTGKYICCVKDKNGNTWTLSADWSLEMKMWFGEFGEIKNMVTHWMPLPEPPKMKGGAE